MPSSPTQKPSQPIWRPCACANGWSTASPHLQDLRKSCAISPATPTGSPSPTGALIACDEKGVTFKWKDYRIEGPERYGAMTLATGEFIRRFLIHVLPAGFHRIRYYGMLNSSKRAENVARARELLLTPPPVIPIDAIKAATAKAENPGTKADEQQTPKHPCPCCGGPMSIIERFARGMTPRHQPSAPVAAIRIDTS